MDSQRYWHLRFLAEQLMRAQERRRALVTEADALVEKTQRTFADVATSLGLDPTKNISFNDEALTAVNQEAPAPQPAPVAQAHRGKRRRGVFRRV